MAGNDWPFTMLGRQFFDGTLPQLVRNVGRLADELKRYNDAQAKPVDDYEKPENAEAYVEAARGKWERDGEIEIDDDPKVSVGDDPGAYVQAWVWVYNEDAGLPTPEDRFPGS